VPEWTEWVPFPDPRRLGLIRAPFGPGIYELRRADTKEPVLRGQGGNCASRMSSLLPRPLGTGTRNNEAKRAYVLANLPLIEYRTCACASKEDAKALERRLNREAPCLFPT